MEEYKQLSYSKGFEDYLLGNPKWVDMWDEESYLAGWNNAQQIITEQTGDPNNVVE